jgi:hypothetical protein
MKNKQNHPKLSLFRGWNPLDGIVDGTATKMNSFMVTADVNFHPCTHLIFQTECQTLIFLICDAFISIIQLILLIFTSNTMDYFLIVNPIHKNKRTLCDVIHLL